MAIRLLGRRPLSSMRLPLSLPLGSPRVMGGMLVVAPFLNVVRDDGATILGVP